MQFKYAWCIIYANSFNSMSNQETTYHERAVAGNFFPERCESFQLPTEARIMDTKLAHLRLERFLITHHNK